MAHHSHTHGQPHDQAAHVVRVKKYSLDHLRWIVKRRYIDYFHSNPIFTNYRSSGVTPWTKRLIIAAVTGVVGALLVWNQLSSALQIVVGITVTALWLCVLAIVWYILRPARSLRHSRQIVRELVLDTVQWRGDERVLDVACGSGMLLNGCAQKLTTGQAIGIDIWKDTSGSSDYQTLMANARSEGVADRIEFQHMDAKTMTFGDNTFDVVVCSWALHHMGHTAMELGKIVLEMIRVLKPGGTLTLVDVPQIMEIAEAVMNNHGMVDVRQHNANRPGPVDSWIVTGQKGV